MAYAKLDPANRHSNIVLSGGDLTLTGNGGGNIGYIQALANAKSTGKFVYEFTFTDNVCFVGLVTTGGDYSSYNGSLPSGVAHSLIFRPDNGNRSVDGGSSGSYSNTPWTVGDVIRVEADLDAGTVEVFQNGTSRGTGGGAALPAGTYLPIFGVNNSRAITVNFGSSAWANTPTSGFTGWILPDLPVGSGASERLTAAGYAAYGGASMSRLTAAANAPAVGAASFLPMFATTVAGAGAMQGLTARAYAHYGNSSFQTQSATSAGKQLDYGRASFEPLAVDGEGIGGTEAHSSFTALPRMSATGTGSAGSVSAGAGVLSLLTAAAYGPKLVDISFEALEASGTSLTGGVARGVPVFARASAAAVNLSQGISQGTGVFAYGTATGRSLPGVIGTGAASMPRTQGRGTGLVGSLGLGSASFQELAAIAAGRSVNIATGAAQFEYLRAAGVGSVVITGSNRTWVLETDGDALTEYQNYNFDALTEFNGAYYGAGSGGVYRLDGSDDAGTPIAWSFRSGLMDGKDPQLKRLEEVLLAMRFDGPVRVRIWTDDNNYYDYAVPNFRAGVIQQVRAKLGKGARSRFFRVEVSGVGSTAADIHSMQLPMMPLGRRIG